MTVCKPWESYAALKYKGGDTSMNTEQNIWRDIWILNIIECMYILFENISIIYCNVLYNVCIYLYKHILYIHTFIIYKLHNVSS